MKLSFAIAIAALAAGAAAAQAPAPAGAGPASGVTLGGPWQVGPALEHPRAGLSAVALDGLVYAAGGAGVVDPRDDFDVLDPAAAVWRGLKPLPQGLERFGMAAADGRIWIAGGYSAESGEEPVADMWSYDPAADVWQSEPALPGPKAAFSLLAFDGRLYAIGGEAGLQGLYVFDLEARDWSALDAPPQTARRGAASVVLEDRLYLIGGVRNGVSSARVDVFNPQTNEWSRAPDLPQPRAGHAADTVNGALHVFGGRSADMRRTLDGHLVLRPGATGWETAPSLPSPRTEMAAATVAGAVHLVGGGVGGGFFAPFTAVDSVDVIRPEGR